MLFFNNIQSGWKKKSKIDKFYFIALSCIIVLAFFLRTYNLKNSQQFLGDQGRDALIVAHIFRDHDLVFIGPVTSIGNMYLGPLYYYWMLPWLWLTYPSPMGPVYAISLLGTLAVALTYFLGKEMVGRRGALIASLILALMPTAIALSRFSWNPNPATLIGLIMIWATWRAVSRSKKYWILVGLSFAILIQLHYVSLLTLPAAGLVWLWQLMQDIKLKGEEKKQALVQTAQSTLGGVLIFLISLTPLILFDIKHHGLNAQAFLAIMGSKGFSSAKINGWAKLGRALKETQGRSLHILWEVTIGKNRYLNKLLLVILTLWLGYLAKFKNLFKRHLGSLILFTYLLVAIIGLSFYTSTVFDHYIAYLYAVTALVLGLALSELIRWQKQLGYLAIGSLIIAESFLLIQLHPWHSAGLTLDEIKATAKLIKKQLPAKASYNIVLLDEAHDLYGMKYRYYLNALDRPVSKPTQAGQVSYLIIVDERVKKARSPFNLGIYEIKVFPHKEVVKRLIGPDGQDIWVLKR